MTRFQDTAFFLVKVVFGKVGVVSQMVGAMLRLGAAAPGDLAVILDGSPSTRRS
jgi:hypothetical protein